MEEMVEDEEEEIKEDLREYPYATIARIDVAPNPFPLKKGARISTGGKIPHRNLAERVPLPRTSNPFHTLLHYHQLENTPARELPTFWDMDRSSRAGSGSFGPEVKEGWEALNKSWDSPMDKLMSRVENNTEMIRNLGFQIEDLKAIIENLIDAIPPLPKDQA